MTAAAFRALALSLPGASEAPHMQRTAFRVGGRIFATLAGDGADAMVKLKPLERVHALLEERPELCFSFGGWTMKLGCLGLRLPEASEADVEALMREAWRELAPKRLRG